LIAGHKGQLHEVVLNLVQNAIDAMDGVSGAPRILRLSTEHHDREVAIAVEDSGPGIDPQEMFRIFDSFFTTKSDGMGLGLAISRMIVEHHFGQIQVSSNPGRGAKFRITLPLMHDASLNAG
jgi:signal transduction histidine kinase